MIGDLLVPLDCDKDLRVMTFRRPWAEAIVRPPPSGATAPHAKRVDNRPRPPPTAQIGRRVALHVGRGIDHRGLRWLNETFGYGWREEHLAEPGRIPGVVRLVGVLSPDEADPWYFGRKFNGKPNYGWRLGALRVLPGEHDYGDGQLGLWRLKPDVHDRLLAEIEATNSYQL